MKCSSTKGAKFVIKSDSSAKNVLEVIKGTERLYQNGLVTLRFSDSKSEQLFVTTTEDHDYRL